MKHVHHSLMCHVVRRAGRFEFTNPPPRTGKWEGVLLSNEEFAEALAKARRRWPVADGVIVDAMAWLFQGATKARKFVTLALCTCPEKLAA